MTKHLALKMARRYADGGAVPWDWTPVEEVVTPEPMTLGTIARDATRSGMQAQTEREARAAALEIARRRAAGAALNSPFNPLAIPQYVDAYRMGIPAVVSEAMQSAVTLPQRLGEGAAEVLSGGDREALVGPSLEATGLIGGGGIGYNIARPVEGPHLGIFAGRNARTANLQKLADAERMEAEGVGPADVWAETGWGRGADGQWRFEIPDNAFRLDPNMTYEQPLNMKVGDVVEHPDLFAAYPDIADVEFRTASDDLLGEAHGAYAGPRDGGEDFGESVWLNTRPRALSGRESTTLHELEHVVQDREGFSPGAGRRTPDVATAARASWDSDRGAVEARFFELQRQRHAFADAMLGPRDSGAWTPQSVRRANDEYRAANPRDAAEEDVAFRMLFQNRGVPDEYKLEAYRSVAGEVEARNVQHRQSWSDAERREVPPQYSEDVDRALQIVRKRAGEGNVGMRSALDDYEGNP